MNGSRLALPTVMVLAALAAGCDGAASARVTTPADPPKPADVASPESAASASAPPAQPASAGSEAAANVKFTRDSSGTIEASFDDVKFPMEKTDDFAESMLTDRVKAMFGQRVRIRGFMFPTPRTKGLKQFVLVRDNLECCFGPGAALFDCIVVNMKEGATAEYTIYPVAVEGTFQLDVLTGPDDRPLAIYHMAGEAVRK